MTTQHSNNKSYVPTHEYKQNYDNDDARHLKQNKNDEQTVRNNKVQNRQLTQSAFHGQLTRSRTFPSTAL